MSFESSAESIILGAFFEAGQIVCGKSSVEAIIYTTIPRRERGTNYQTEA
jgi:hypothetical protein